MLKETKILMDMPVTVAIRDAQAAPANLEKVFAYFEYVDKTFSTYKSDSEISKINRGELTPEEFSQDMKTVFELAAQTKKDSNGYFDIRRPDGKIDPSGLVKGWAIWQAAKLLESVGFENFFVDAGGDVQARSPGQAWSVGIKNPLNEQEIVKVLEIKNEGVATSGTYIRGQHIYNPHQPQKKLEEVISLTVVGPNVYEADRFATAAFAMGKDGINFIEQQPSLEGYQIDGQGIAIMTKGFNHFVQHAKNH